MSNLDKLKEKYEKEALLKAQSAEQKKHNSNQADKLYDQFEDVPEVQKRILDILGAIALETDDPSSIQKNLQIIQTKYKTKYEEFMLHPSPAEKKQDETVVGPSFSKNFAAFFKSYEDSEPSTAQTLAASPAA